MPSSVRTKCPRCLLPVFLIFLLTFLWMAFLNQGRPFSTMDDPTLLYMAEKTPFTKVVSRIINPLTPAWSYSFEMLGGAEQNSLSLRPIELLILKLLFTGFGYTPSVFYLTKALFLALVSLAVFLLIYRISQNNLAAFLGAFFYAATLPVYMSVFFITDFGLLAQFFQCLATLLFVQIVYDIHEKKSTDSNILARSVLLFVLVWLGIKTYETIKIFPLLCLAFLFLRHARQLKAFFTNKQNRLVLATLVCMLLLVVPVTTSFHVTDREGHRIVRAATLPYFTDSLCRSLVQNTRNAWENEPSCAFFSLDACLPFSMARCLGLFLCWAFILLVIFFAANRRALMKNNSPSGTICFYFLWLWLAADVVALGLHRESDPRHLMLPLIPFCVAFAALAFLALTALKGPRRVALTILCLVGFAWAVPANLGHQIYFRKFLGGVEIAQDRYLKYIFEDYRKKPPASYSEMIDFMLVPQQLCAWCIPFILDDQYGTFLERIQPDNLRSLYSKYGAAYIVTIQPDLIPNDPRYVKIAAFDEINDSLFSRWILRFKKKKGGVHTLYKFVPS